MSPGDTPAAAGRGETLPRADAVFEGGGVKAIALVGAAAAIRDAHYIFENLAGTSGGAIVAGLLAAGLSGEQIRDKLKELDYLKFEDARGLARDGWTGKALHAARKFGIYAGEFFEEWFGGLLAETGRTRFGDIPTGSDDERFKYRFQAIASDLTDRKLLVLPGSLRDFGFDPDEFSIARAVRMSISIPGFFEPVKLIDNDGLPHYIVDGGLLSNYPVWLLDDGGPNPPWPTFGFKLMGPNARKLTEGARHEIRNVFDFAAELVKTMNEAHDRYHISVSAGDFQRTIPIPTTVMLPTGPKAITTTDFKITPEESQLLYDGGWEAAKAFLATWDFESWKARYRCRTPAP